MKQGAGATSTPKATKPGMKKKPEVTPKNKNLVNSQKILKTAVSKTNIAPPSKKPLKPKIEKSKTQPEEEQDDFVVLSDQKDNTQVNTNSDQSSKENSGKTKVEVKTAFDEKKFDDDLCNQVDQLLNGTLKQREIIQIPAKKKKRQHIFQQAFENKQIRCRTETPENVENRPTSPSKILQKHMARQQRAEMIRAQIVQNRQKQMERIWNRQKENKSRVDQINDMILQEKRNKLNDKILMARENRGAQLNNIKQRAQMDVQAVEDIKFIMRMNQSNLKLDINNKLNETEIRRNQHFAQVLRKLDEQKQKEEEVQKKRLALSNIKLEEIRKAEARRLQAQKRKHDIISQKKKAEEEKQKRAMVLQRKNEMGQKLSDFNSLVNNQVWELIGIENSFKADNLMVNDVLNLEKIQLKEEAEFLSKIISFDANGKMSVKLEQNDYKQFYKMLRGNEYLSNSSSDVSSSDESDERKSGGSMQYKFKKNNEDKKSINSCNYFETSHGKLASYDGSVNGELEPTKSENLDLEPRRNSQHNQLTSQSLSLLNKENKIQNTALITDDEELLMLIESRMHWSIKRNVLKETMSEDLVWAQCIKNENEDFFEKMRYQNARELNLQETRSLQSTPEKRRRHIEEVGGQRDKSADDRIFGSASSRRRFKRSSRLNSRKSSISSNVYQSLHKSKSKDILSNSNILLESKSLQMLNKDSKNKRGNSRDSYDSHRIMGRSSLGSIQPRNLFQNTYTNEEANDDEEIQNMAKGDFGSQMNQLITNMQPLHSFQQTKILPKLSSNAQKILFPIREQKILFKRPGKEGQFINVRVTIKLDDLQQLIQSQAQTHQISQEAVTSEQDQLNIEKNQSNENTPKKPKQVVNNQIFKESAVKYLLGGQYNDLLKNEDAQKSIELQDEDLKKIEQFLDRLESSELNFRYCRLCESILQEENEEGETKIEAQTEHEEEEDPAKIDQLVIQHVLSHKNHKKLRDDLGIKEIEDHCFSILNFNSVPGDISKELVKEKEKALKRKVKRLKVQLQQMAVSHENAGCQQAWKDYSSQNKKTLQIRCLDLEKLVNPSIRDYEALEQNLKEIIKLLQFKNQGDLMLFRKLKFIPTLADICKRILICPKQEFKHLGKAIELSIKIIALFCTLRENRNYMLQTNRIMPLVDLLNWCMSRPTQIFFGISFLPQLFQIITLHIKHRTPYECIQSKEFIIEILICSQLMQKIKNKFSIINYPMAMDISQMMGQVPMFLLKSITFLEALTSITSSDSRYRPVYERNNKIGEHYLFVIENTELFGIINMISTLLLTHSEQFKTSYQSQESDQNVTKIMPQTFLSLSIVSIKVLNNIIRMDVKFVQKILVKNEIIFDQLFHLINYLLVYTHENYDKNEDNKELLHETLMFIGYFCLQNDKTQAILSRGENTIMQKLCNLPFPYFSDKKMKEILFPTLIMASYKSERCVAIMNQEISFDPIIKFLQANMKEELPRIMEEEFDYQSISSLGERGKVRGRSPSMSSTNSSGCSIQMETISNGNCPYLPLFMRFPKSKWQDAIDFYQSVE